MDDLERCVPGPAVGHRTPTRRPTRRAALRVRTTSFPDRFQRANRRSEISRLAAAIPPGGRQAASAVARR